MSSVEKVASSAPESTPSLSALKCQPSPSRSSGRSWTTTASIAAVSAQSKTRVQLRRATEAATLAAILLHERSRVGAVPALAERRPLLAAHMSIRNVVYCKCSS